MTYADLTKLRHLVTSSEDSTELRAESREAVEGLSISERYAITRAFEQIRGLTLDQDSRDVRGWGWAAFECFVRGIGLDPATYEQGLQSGILMKDAIRIIRAVDPNVWAIEDRPIP